MKKKIDIQLSSKLSLPDIATMGNNACTLPDMLKTNNSGNVLATYTGSDHHLLIYIFLSVSCYKTRIERHLFNQELEDVIIAT